MKFRLQSGAVASSNPREQNTGDFYSTKPESERTVSLGGTAGGNRKKHRQLPLQLCPKATDSGKCRAPHGSVWEDGQSGDHRGERRGVAMWNRELGSCTDLETRMRLYSACFRKFGGIE